jgi:hypothetical protein
MSARLCLVLPLLGLLGSLQPTSAQVSVTTYHNDNARTGHNLNEVVLTPFNVNRTTFGKLFTIPVDGQVYAQPLVLAGVTIQGTKHTIAYVATEHDSVYAIDADIGTIYWKVSFINLALDIIPIPLADVACSDLASEIGVTSTPVIAPGSGTIYMLALTRENGSYFQRLHALDVATGKEKFGGPLTIQATINGKGDGSVAGKLSFNPRSARQRSALLLQNGHVVIAWASYCDSRPYHGWVMSYNATTLAQEAVYSVTPDGKDGGIWMSGSGLAADSSSNLYFATGNGTFNGNNALGDSIVKLGPPANQTLPLLDFFAPFDQSSLNLTDTDLGSGGVLLLPTLPAGSPHPRLLVQAAKSGTIYLVDRDNMGKFCSTCVSQNTQIAQELPGALLGSWATPAYWNRKLYFGSGTEEVGGSDYLKAFSWNANGDGLISTFPTSQTAKAFGYSTPTPSVSANGNNNGIVWALDNVTYKKPCCQVLYAYDANNLGRLLYASYQAPNQRDVPGQAIKFSVPTIANGKVYIAGGGHFSVYGLLSANPVIYETETLPTLSSGPAFKPLLYSGFPDGVGTVFYAPGAGANLSFTVKVANAGTYRVRVSGNKGPNRGSWQLAVDGANVGPVAGEYSATVGFVEYDLGTASIPATGNHTFKFTVTGKNASSTAFFVSFDYIRLIPQ